MALKCLDGLLGIVVLVNVRRGEFDGASIAADDGFEIARCLIVKDVPVDMNDMGIFPLLVNVLVGFDEISGFARLHALVIVPSSLAATMIYLCLRREMTGKRPI